MAMILTNATLATMTGGYGLIADAALVMDQGSIVWAGPAADLPLADFADLPVQDLGGRLVTPALIDCHTHLVFAGNRAQEFEMRLNGASYEEVARAGGGIVSTVRATRAAQEEDLFTQSLPRLDALLADGGEARFGPEREMEAGALRRRGTPTARPA